MRAHMCKTSGAAEFTLKHPWTYWTPAPSFEPIEILWRLFSLIFSLVKHEYKNMKTLRFLYLFPDVIVLFDISYLDRS
jgi:hypothetical protein